MANASSTTRDRRRAGRALPWARLWEVHPFRSRRPWMRLWGKLDEGMEMEEHRVSINRVTRCNGLRSGRANFRTSMNLFPIA